MAVVEKMQALAAMILPTRPAASTPAASTPAAPATQTQGLTVERFIAELARQKRSAT